MTKIKVKRFDVKYVKNGNSYDVGPIGFTLDDLQRLKVKVTNGAVTAIGMCGYTPVGLTGVLVFNFCFQPFGCLHLMRKKKIKINEALISDSVTFGMPDSSCRMI